MSCHASHSAVGFERPLSNSNPRMIRSPDMYIAVQVVCQYEQTARILQSTEMSPLCKHVAPIGWTNRPTDWSCS